MKPNKFRYDDKKLSRDSALKKRIALYLAQEFVKNDKHGINLIETLAYGLTIRPFAAYSEKDLIKLFDKSYTDKLELLEQKKKEQIEYNADPRYRGWRAENKKDQIKELEKLIAEMQPMIDELIEEAFSS